MSSEPTQPSQPIAIVTGAARRIGRAIALDLARHGWSVCVHHHHSGEAAAEVVAEIVAGGGRAVAVAADLADAQAVLRLVPDCCRQLSAPALLVNNASIFLYDDVESLTPEQWDRQMAVNLRAPVLLAQAFAAHLPATANASIINLIDQRVLRPTPQFLSYATAKSGLYAATLMLAQALAPRIRVNGIGPGPVLASIHQTPEQFARQVASLPLGHGPSPEEIAGAVRFLVASPSITGQMIALDGGQHLAWRTPDVGVDAVSSGATSIQSAPPAPTLPHRGSIGLCEGIRRVLVKDLEIRTVIGVHDEEKRAPQRVLVNVELAVREDGPFESDRLEDVVDYSAVVARIEAIAAAGHVNLVETLAERVAAGCLADPKVLAARVRIEKPDVIANARGVGVEIERKRLRA